jgi:hypothetical protein
VSGHLVGPAAFKAVGTGDPRPAGSIPVHLRWSRLIAWRGRVATVSRSGPKRPRSSTPARSSLRSPVRIIGTRIRLVDQRAPGTHVRVLISIEIHRSAHGDRRRAPLAPPFLRQRERPRHVHSAPPVGRSGSSSPSATAPRRPPPPLADVDVQGSRRRPPRDSPLSDATNLCRVRRMKKLLLLLIVLAIAGVAARQLTSS